jgi:small subunit ribosomal protein S2
MISIEELLEAGVHFGHRINKWNPKMAPYIFGERNGVHIIDLIQTLGYLDSTYTFLNTYSTPNIPTTRNHDSNSLGKKVLIVGTRKQVAAVIKKEAEDCNANYVNYRWLGGLLTNWATIRLCVAKLNALDTSLMPNSTELKSKESQDISSTNSFSAVIPQAVGKEKTKKERAILKKQYEKLKKFFGGIQHMTELPEIVILVGQDCEMNAVRECHTLSEKVITKPAESSDKNTSVLKNSKGGQKEGIRSQFQSESRTAGLDVGRLNLRTITILDTNCDPSLADLFIPANDDSTKSVELILGKLGEAIRTNTKY